LKNISLLPAELRNYQRSAKKINRYSVVMAFFILGFVLIYAVLSLAANVPQQGLNNVRQQRKSVQQKINELQAYEEMLNTSENARILVSEAMGKNPEWDTLFVGIFNSIPQGAWLSDFTSTFSEATGELSIRGWAESHATVADWLAVLKTLEGLGSVQCQFIEKNGTDSGNEVQFEIKAVLNQRQDVEMPVEGGIEQ